MFVYTDYENAYYQGRVDDCRKIGCYLLATKKDEKSKKLFEELSKIEYQWDLPQKQLEHIAQVLQDVKIWLMVNF